MNEILNKSQIDYEYKINPNDPADANNIESNETITDLVLGSLSMTKSVDKAYATIGDILTYTVNINNNGNVLVSDVVFKDIIPSGATFVEESVIVDGTPQPTFNPNTGFNLGSMLLLASKTVVFQVEVDSLPSPNTISNSATTTFNYLVLVPIGGSASSNIVVTTINVSTLTVVKSANVTAVTVGDTLTYTTVITNTGNIDAENVEFTDSVDNKLTFVVGSVVVNGTPQPTFNPNVGFSLGTLSPTDVTTVVFDTTVN